MVGSNEGLSLKAVVPFDLSESPQPRQIRIESWTSQNTKSSARASRLHKRHLARPKRRTSQGQGDRRHSRLLRRISRNPTLPLKSKTTTRKQRTLLHQCHPESNNSKPPTCKTTMATPSKNSESKFFERLKSSTEHHNISESSHTETRHTTSTTPAST